MSTFTKLILVFNLCLLHLRYQLRLDRHQPIAASIPMARLSLLFRLPRLFPSQRLLSPKVPPKTIPRSLYTRLGGHVGLDERV
jgi:hypothetical protein